MALPPVVGKEREALTNVKTSLVPAVIGYFMTSCDDHLLDLGGALVDGDDASRYMRSMGSRM